MAAPSIDMVSVIYIFFGKNQSFFRSQNLAFNKSVHEWFKDYFDHILILVVETMANLSYYMHIAAIISIQE